MKYAKEILSSFEMVDCNLAVTPAEGTLTIKRANGIDEVDPIVCRQLIGSLKYLCQSRLDISFAKGSVKMNL